VLFNCQVMSIFMREIASHRGRWLNAGTDGRCLSDGGIFLSIYVGIVLMYSSYGTDCITNTISKYVHRIHDLLLHIASHVF
jgi:hypothetical protein